MFLKAVRLTAKCFLSAALIACLLSCSASKQFSRSAQKHELTREDITANSLPLVIFREAIPRGSSTIHFYIDGDGSPWVHGRRIAKDPTSRSQNILRLMAQDNTHKILIGRPCYYIAPVERPAVCHEKWWTSHRYSEQVVNAMSELINAQIERYEPHTVRLIGYSGGGTLAMLIAENLNNEIDGVVTIVANLDVDQWIALHGYSPLATSLNDTNFPRLPEHIQQIHFVGTNDKNVPVEVTKAVVSNQPNARLIEVEGYSHECCWPKDWASRLEMITTGD